MSGPEPEQDSDMWIRSYPDDNGRYNVVLELGQDDVIPVDSATAYGWAREVLSAVAAAEYDAATLNQIKSLGLDREAAAVIIMKCRSDRADAVPLSLIPGLALISGVSQSTGSAFLRLERNGEPVGQWTMDDAREHALTLLTAVEVALLDGAYLRALQTFGIGPDRAQNVVADLFNYRVST